MLCIIAGRVMLPRPRRAKVGGLHTSLNTGFLSIFDFGGAFKDGGPPFINVDTNKRESYILAIFNYLNEHLWFWWYT